MKLADQQHGYGQTGLYHDGIRIDELGSFKVQHMGFFVKVLLHNHMKYNLAEEDLSDSMCKMAPIYSRRSTRPDVISGLAITGAHWMIATWQRRPEPARKQRKLTILFSKGFENSTEPDVLPAGKNS